MTQLPDIAQATLTFTQSLPWLFPDLKLTEDDRFLITLNSVFSNRIMFPDGFANHPRYYKFNQRLPFEHIPEHDLSISKDIDTVVEHRAKELLNKNQPIKVFWSGGIDSTLATAALLSHAKHKDQISVYHTCESIRENPHFYDFILSHGVDTVMWSDSWSTPFNSNDLLVTGTSSDEITGSLDKSFYEKNHNQLSGNWRDYFKQNGFPHLIERCEELFSKSHSPIETLFDTRWWFYFYIRHTYFARRDWDLNLENNFASNVAQFFNCKEFDAWSVHNKHSIIGSKYSDYKMPFKQATNRYWQNNDYLVNKEKVNSYLTTMWMSKKVSAFSQHYLFIYKNADGDYVKFSPPQSPFVSKKQVLEALHVHGY